MGHLRATGGFVWIALLTMATAALPAEFDLFGQLQPKQSAQVYAQGATTPFHGSAEAGLNGKFQFRKLTAGPYVLMVNGVQRTVEVGPSLADSKGRVKVTIDLADGSKSARGTERVSVRELSISKPARREYELAEKALGRKDAAAAVMHLKQALKLTPQFSDAWNNLGTIAYQAGNYQEAEADFRSGLKADPEAYAPLVNLGGVLLNLGRWREALDCNLQAAIRSPQDPLANSQLGMAYFYSGQMDLAERYLRAAKHIDPAHFSHPQSFLAEIQLRRNRPGAAADELQDLVNQHPDLVGATKIKDQIAVLREREQ